MGISKLEFMIGLLVAISFLISPAGCHQHNGESESSLFFIFGDSNFDSGNNNYINTTVKANFPPYGETFFHHPTGRFSNGRLIPDFIAEYAKLPLIQPYYQPGNHELHYGVNFASGGAGALTGTGPGLAINLEMQLANFRNVTKLMVHMIGKNDAKQLLANAVYLFDIGANDYFYPWFTNTSTTFFRSLSHEQYVDMVIGNITMVIKEIYDQGGRKFGFTNLPPINCYPTSRALNPVKKGDCIDELSIFIKLHNAALSVLLQKLQGELELFTYSLFDLHNAVSKRMRKQSKYGFKDGFSACCGSGPSREDFTCGIGTYQLCDDPNEHLFWDAIHFSEKAHQQFAELMWNGTTKTTQPCNLMALFEHIQL